MKTALKHHLGSTRPSTSRLASGDHNYYTLKFFVAKSSITEPFDFRNYVNLICFKPASQNPRMQEVSRSTQAEITGIKRCLAPVRDVLQTSST